MATPVDDRPFYFRDAEGSSPSDPFTERVGSGSGGVAAVTPGRQRRSFVARLRQASKATSWRDLMDDEPFLSPAASERPPIPSALPLSGEATNTPLPVVPMIVLSIVSPSLPVQAFYISCLT